MRRLAMACVLAAAGCHAVTPQEEATQVAEAYCRCVDPGDDACVTQLVTAMMGTGDDCAACVYQNEKTCANMVQECTPLCEPQVVNQPGGQP